MRAQGLGAEASHLASAVTEASFISAQKGGEEGPEGRQEQGPAMHGVYGDVSW